MGTVCSALLPGIDRRSDRIAVRAMHSAPGTRIAPLLAALAEFERDWLRERGVMFRGCEHSWLKANRIGK